MFSPPVPPPQVGPTGPTGATGPTAVGCCPCNNVLNNPGFDIPPVGVDPVPGWNQAGSVSEVGFPNVHSGRFLPDGSFSLLAASISPGGSINQTVDVDNVVFQPTGGPCTSCSQNF